MKKITLVLVTLAFVAGMAVAEDVTLSVSGSATVEWGFAGQLIDNTGSFLDAELASGDFYSSDDSGDLSTMDVPEFTFTMSVEDADGNVIVEAATTEIEVTYELVDSEGDEVEDFYGEPIVIEAFPLGLSYETVLDYISFPNVIPGILGITLAGDDALEPGYAASGSTSENERILIDVTPIPQLDATVGLLIKPDNKLYRNFYDTGDATFPDPADNGTFTWPDYGDADDLDDFDDFSQNTDIDVLLDDDDEVLGWENSTYLSYALSLEATFTQSLGGEDEISVGLGTVIDSAFTNDVYQLDYLVDGTDNDYEVFHEDVPLINDLGTQFVIDEMYGPISVSALSIEEFAPTLFDVTSTDEAKELRTNEVLGRATIPVGLGIGASVAGIEAAVDFQMVLAEGNADDNFTGIIDLTDETKNTINFAPYAMPMYAAVDVGYELALGDMSITPGVNFKYSSDYWKWGENDDDDGFEYQGDVSGADFVGRPMSLDVGIDVEGIAGMIDVSISASVALGDGKANHGWGRFNGATPLAIAPYEGLVGALGSDMPNYTFTHDTGTIETVVVENTLAELIDFWYTQPTLADADTNYWTAGTDKPADAADGLNNNYFPTGASAMGIEAVVTVMPIDGLTLENTTSYEIDNLGIGGADDVTLFGEQLSSLSNETEVTYDWMVGDAVAFTIFGLFTYESVSYDVEAGQKYIGLRTDADPAGITDVFEFGYSEAPSMATFDYAIGVRCEVGL